MINQSLLRVPIISGQKGLEIPASKVPLEWKTEKTQKPMVGSLPEFSNLLFFIPFHSLIFKSTKLKDSNKPLSFPIPPPPCKSRTAIIIVVSDKVMVIWLCSPRAQTKDRSYQGTDTAQGSFSRVSCTLMPSLGSTSHPQFSHCPGHVLLSLSTE